LLQSEGLDDRNRAEQAPFHASMIQSGGLQMIPKERKNEHALP
jgi:hypothetical protein